MSLNRILNAQFEQAVPIIVYVQSRFLRGLLRSTKRKMILSALKQHVRIVSVMTATVVIFLAVPAAFG